MLVSEFEACSHTPFSDVYYLSADSREMPSVIKACKQNSSELLQAEYQILTRMAKYDGFPSIIGQEHGKKGQIKAIVMPKLGISLKSLMLNSKLSEIKIPHSYILKIGLKMVARVEELHREGFLHRDIKPDHFLFQNDDPESQIFLIDFGFSKRIDQLNLQVTSLASKTFQGNPMYASVNKMKFGTQTIRDDLESVLFIIGEMLCGQLPWRPKKTTENGGNLFLRILKQKQNSDKWASYKTWIKNSLYKVRNSEDPYQQIRKNLQKILLEG